MMRVILWGTYDTGKPRVRILRRGLIENCVEVIECHREIWTGIEDKSQLNELSHKLLIFWRWLTAYPRLIICYLLTPPHSAVVVGYLGHVDILVLWPFAKLRGTPIIWDAFLSLYSTIVEDRRLLTVWNPAAWLLYALEWLACRAADRIVLDTRAHADYFSDMYQVSPERIDVVWVGSEPEVFTIMPSADRSPVDEKIVLFYGQFIPLHGIETIIRAAREMQNEAIHWVIIGNGQETEKIRKMLDESPLPRVEWLPWVNYPDLAQWIHRADVCLGIFGDTDKASRVIPNKVFQILMCGKPLITRDSPAIRELVGDAMPGVWLVPPADPAALAMAVRDISIGEHAVAVLPSAIRQRILPSGIGRQMVEVINHAIR